MTAASDSENTVELIMGEGGDFTLAVRPCLPFLAESCRILENGRIRLSGEGLRIDLNVESDALSEMREEGQVLLVEFPVDGSRSEREVVLAVSA